MVRLTEKCVTSVAIIPGHFFRQAVSAAVTLGVGDLSGGPLGSSSFCIEELRRAFLAGGSGECASLDDLLVAAFLLTRSRGGDSEGLLLAARDC